jgi:vancomycin resistance protein YoaR
MARHEHTHQKITPLMQGVYAIGWGLISFLVLFLLLNFGFSLIYVGRILPGVSMNGVSLSGQTVDQATSTIASTYRYSETGTVLLVDGEKSWMVRPVQLGFYLDPVASANAAYEAGRKGNVINVLLQRMSLFKEELQAQPSFIFDQKTAINYLKALAAEIDQPVREASISIYGTEVVVQNGQIGRVLDIAATLDAVTLQIQSMQDGVVPLTVRQSDPIILSAEEQGQLARTVLSEPLSLTLPADASGAVGTIQIQASDLAPLLTFEKVNNTSGAQYQIAVSKPLMTAYLTSLKDDLELEPKNSRFIFNDDTRQLEVIETAVIGRMIDIDSSITAIDQAFQSGAHSAAINFIFTNPPVTDQMTGAELGITELVGENISYFVGSTTDRVQNIQTASARFHGLLIAPGATLSMSDVLGDISLDNGYAEALIILGDETIKGVGGGVCQVSTTLFRTAFYAGYPIVERHPHAYRVKYYEQINSSGSHDPSLAGLDATVFVPLVDFKFTNDTLYWLLMETYVNPDKKSLWWKFYSTSDGRQVNWNTTGPQNIVNPPEPVYRENSELPQGTKKQVDWAVEGADITVNRTVTRDGAVLYQDTFFTQYEPWGDVYEYGPGTEIPTPTPSP